jgi:uncharacterized membrane protein
MKPKEFLNRLDDERVTAAIRAAEGRTSGEIRVFVSRQPSRGKAVLALATARFERLGMTATADRNGVLLFFLPVEQKFAILGDTGIDAKCGPTFWDDIAHDLTRDLRVGDFTAAVVRAINRAGTALATHFPRNPDDHNELPDTIERD